MSTSTPTLGARVIPFPTHRPSSPRNPGYDPLFWNAFTHFRAQQAGEDRLAAVRDALATATPIQRPGEHEMLKLLRRIDRRLATLQKGAAA